MGGTIKKISINRLVLYNENPRHEIGHDEKDTLEKLFSVVGVQQMLNLAEDIYKHGLVGAQQVVVVPYDNTYYTVYEGNRRVAAIKLLQNPRAFSFLEKAQIDRINRLTKTGGKITQIPCYITNEEDALFIMKRRHLGDDKGRGIRPWGPREKEAFETRQSKKKSISFLIDSCIKKYFDGYDISVVLSFTSIKRVFGPKSIRDAIGLDLEDINSFTYDRIKLVKEASEWIADESRKTGVAITRMFNTVTSIEEKLLPWIWEYQSKKENNCESLKISSGENKKEESENSYEIQELTEESKPENDEKQNEDDFRDSKKATLGKTVNLPYFFQGLDTSHLDLNDSDSHGVLMVCKEIILFSNRRLVKDFPLSAAFLVRALIEQSIIFYSKKHNIQGQNKTIFTKMNGIINLGSIIENFNKNLANYIPDTKVREYFSAMFSDYNTKPLNWVIHRPSEFVLGEKDLLNLPRKGLLAIVNFFIA